MVLATRNPMLLFVLSGVLLLRLEERTLFVLLFHEPTCVPHVDLQAREVHGRLFRKEVEFARRARFRDARTQAEAHSLWKLSVLGDDP